MGYDYISSLLIKSAETKDVKLFKAWERKQVTTNEAIEIFLKNNKARTTYFISTYDFEKWLNSLGYRRGK